MPREPPPLPPPPPPPESFPIPFARQRSTDRTQNVYGTSAYHQAGPPPGSNHPVPMPSHSTHTFQQYTYPQPPPPPPVRRSTRPHSNVTAPAPAPTPAFPTQPAPPYEYAPPPPPPQMSRSTSHHSSSSNSAPSPAFPTQPAPPYEYAPPPPPPQMSGSISHHSSGSNSGPSIPARPPFTVTGTNDSGPRPPQRLTTMLLPIRSLPNTAASVPYHYGSSPPNIAYPRPPPPQSAMSGGSPPNTQDWSYLDSVEGHERDDLSSDSGDEDFVESPDNMSNSSGYMGRKGPTNPPLAGRRRRTRRRETAPASSSQAPPEVEKCKLCPRQGPRHEWARLGHGGFCCERHKWQWEETYAAHSNMVHRSRGSAP